jgi:hypothetical protein
MSDAPNREGEEEEEKEEPALSALLKRSLSPEAAPAPVDDKKLLQGVQRKLRKRSKGKFYGDGWSTSQSRLNYALIAAVMLVTIVAVYLALGPTGISLR